MKRTRRVRQKAKTIGLARSSPLRIATHDGSPKSGGPLSAFVYPGGLRFALAAIEVVGDADLTLTSRQEQIENMLHPTREVNSTPCGRRPLSSVCAPRSDGSQASTGAPRRRYPSVSAQWMPGFPAERCRLARCMRSPAAATARLMARPPRFSRRGSPPARAARCSGVSPGWTCLRRRSRKLG